MLRRRVCIGIHLDRDRIFVVLVRFHGGFNEVVQHAEIELPDNYLEGDERWTEAAGQGLRRALAAFGRGGLPVMAVAHTSSLLVRTFRLPPMSERDMQRALVYEIPRRLTLPPQDFLFDFVPVRDANGWAIVSVSVRKNMVLRAKELLEQAGVRRCRLDVEPFAAWRLVPGVDRKQGPHFLVTTTESRAMICLWEGPVLLQARYVPVEDWESGKGHLLEQMMLTWQYGSVEAGEQAMPPVILIGGHRANEAAQFLELTQSAEVIAVDPTTQVVCRTAEGFRRVKETGIFAVGAALLGGGYRVATG